jgi:transposase
VVLCQQLGLFSEALVAVDGAKFKAVNNRDRNFTSAKLQRRMEEIESSINDYLAALDTADRHEPSVAQAKSVRLEHKITALKAQMQALKAIEVRLNETPDTQIPLTDPDARSMKTRGTEMVGYNVQTAVDAQHHLIVAHQVTNVGTDRSQLSSMAKQANIAMGEKDLTVVADRGYFKGEEILACEEAGISAFVAKPQTSGSKAEGRFGKQDFVYIAQDDQYRCPAGQRLIKHMTTVEEGMTLHCYWGSVCPACPMKAHCTTGKERRVKRWEHEAVLESDASTAGSRP